MNKINIGTQGFPMSMPQTILGTMQEGKPNWMALAWVTRVNYKPALIAMGVGTGHQSLKNTLENGEFSICIPSCEMLVATDYVGLVSGKRTDKSAVFEHFTGTLEHAPMVKNAPVCLECKVYDTMTLPTNTLVVGEIVATWTEERFCTNDVPDPEKVRPFSLTMPDNRYWAVGDCIGKAWSDGKAMK